VSTPEGNKARVLVVDDEPQVLVALEDLLSDEFVVLKAESGERALRVIDDEPELAVIVSDQRMPKMCGDELLARLDGRCGATRMLVTGFADLGAVIRAVNEGRIFAYVAKPWEPGDFRLKVQRAAEHFKLAQELAQERRLLNDLMDNTPDGIYFKDAELRFLRANRPIWERMAEDASALVGKRLSDVLADDVEVVAGEVEERRLIEEGVPVREVTRSQLSAGSVRWYSESKAPIRAPSGEVVGLVGISRDVTLKRQQESRIARLTKVYSLISGINAAIVRAQSREALLAEACAIAVTAGELAFAAVVRVEPATAEVTLVAHEPRDARIVEDLRTMHETYGPRRSPILAKLCEGRDPAILNDIAESPQIRLRAELVREGLRAAALFPLSSAGALHSVFCLFGGEPGFFDAEEVKLLGEVTRNLSFALDHIGKRERLEFLAFHDGLTGLPNRDLFLDRASQQLAAARRDGKMVGVVLVDVGRFRQMNETLGRQGGDALLVKIAERLESVVGDEGTLARLFGNTFALLVPAVESESFVGLLIENEVIEVLRESFVIDGTEVLASCRVGAAVFPSDGDSAEMLLGNAEAALKKAKASGQPYVFYAPVMNARVSEQLALETKLRRAVERDEFLLHYQPKVDLKTGAIVGLEALIRWRDPESGLVPPGKFIPLLEETGLIREVGRWVLERAALQYHEWVRAGHEPPRIAVNVSGLQLAAKDFVARLERVLMHYPDGASGIDLEITESVFVDDLDGSIKKLEAARRHGLTVAMDDFGTGYSSLSSLGRLPLDSLKVDRSFVLRMTEDPQSTSIVTTIISLGHALELKVVAEGVETAEQARLLRLLKCDQAQGYLIARPKPAEEIVSLLGTRVDLNSASRG
jgi:diguanylate cyclase (GGDEF)-like protein/PAS domain S-box-containing protein